MKAADRFDHYLADLSEGLDHTDRHAGLRGYCTSLMLPLSRVPSNGCSSSGLQRTPSRASTSCPRCPRKRRSTSWSASPISVGASSATTGSEAGLQLGALRRTRLAGFRHHAALSIAADGFLMAQRFFTDKSVGSKKTSPHAKCLQFPRIASPVAVLRA